MYLILLRRNIFKILQSVIVFVSVFVVHKVSNWRLTEKSKGDKSMKKYFVLPVSRRKHGIKIAISLRFWLPNFSRSPASWCAAEAPKIGYLVQKIETGKGNGSPSLHIGSIAWLY